jgi:hypothetical protein
VEITSGSESITLLSNGKLQVPNIIQTDPEEDLVIRTRYAGTSSPPSSTPTYTNRNFTFGTNGTLTFPNGSVQSGASISLSSLKTIVASSASWTDFQTAIAAL